MGDVFLHVPERLAGYPITLDEAVSVLLKRVYGENFRLAVTPEQAVQMATSVWRGLCLNLATNDLHSFVQADETGSWYRIPSDYWGDWWLLSGHVAMSPPNALRPIPKVGWVPANFDGAVVVVWQADVDRLAEKWDASYARYKAAQEGELSEDLSQPEPQTDANAAPAVVRPVSYDRLRQWIEMRNREGWSQIEIFKGAAEAFPGQEVPGRPTLHQIDAEVRKDIGLEARRRGRGKKGI